MTDVTKMTSVDPTLPIEDRINFLRHCEKMYAVGTPPISDAQYDLEYYNVCDWLEANDPEHPYLDEVGGEHIYGTKVKHEVIMGSLSKCLDIEAFHGFVKTTYPNCEKYSYQLQHKIDGLSLSLTYEDGKLLRAVTRGDGAEGVDVTSNAVYVYGVQRNIVCQDRVEVRGECYKDRKNFYKKWHHSVMDGGYANPRNFAAGSINQKDATVTKERGLSFVAYEVVQKDFETEKDKMEFLEKNGFPTLRSSTKWTKAGIGIDGLVKAAKVYMDSIDRKNLPYDIDGVVVKVDDIAYGQSMGSVSNGRKPKSARAIKFPAEESAPTPIIRIEANVGRTGKICPVAIVQPVELGGAMMSRVTLHNYGAILNSKPHEIHIGTNVVIAKKGDIIPQIVKVINNSTTQLTDVSIPTECPSCNEALKWTTNADGEKVDLVCDNFNCIAQLNAKIENWLKKIGVKGIGSGTISKLTDKDILSWEGHAIIESLPEMYYMLTYDKRSEHPFRKYAYLKEQLGEKTYENIVKSIKSVEEVPLHTFVEALGIAKIGSMSKDIVDVAPSLEEIDDLTVAEVEALPGFGIVKAENFINGWRDAADEVKLLKRYVKPVVQQPASDVLKGKKFCFTGSFSVGRKELEKLVVDNGGKCGSVGKDTILVWDGAMTGGKYDKANKLNCEIISEDDFNALLED
ncbi:MAG TPA: NAD-dependent DNA ligase LigA [Patescibacteria group bacterium]|nr:NAD-dependent DNA ligase LigA [Patescibacteria group bacterium]